MQFKLNIYLIQSNQLGLPQNQSTSPIWVALQDRPNRKLKTKKAASYWIQKIIEWMLIDWRQIYLVTAMATVFILGSSNGWPGLRKERHLKALHLLGKECIGLYAVSKRQQLQDSCRWNCNRTDIRKVFFHIIYRVINANSIN